MKVLKHLAHLMWEPIGDLADDPAAQSVAAFAEQSGAVWSLGAEDAE